MPQPLKKDVPLTPAQGNPQRIPQRIPTPILHAKPAPSADHTALATR